MKFIYSIAVGIVLISAIACNRVSCIPNLELKPMYGKEERCEKQKEASCQFVARCEQEYGSKEKACFEILRFGWKHQATGDLDRAMERFNEAWLLDSLNADVYLGFGSVLTDKGNFDQARRFYNRSLELAPDNVRTLKMAALNLQTLAEQMGNPSYTKKAIERLEQASRLASEDENIYVLLTQAYIYMQQPDSAKKYLEQAEVLNQEMVDDVLRNRVGK